MSLKKTIPLAITSFFLTLLATAIAMAMFVPNFYLNTSDPSILYILTTIFTLIITFILGERVFKVDLLSIVVIDTILIMLNMVGITWLVDMSSGSFIL